MVSDDTTFTRLYCILGFFTAVKTDNFLTENCDIFSVLPQHRLWIHMFKVRTTSFRGF